MNAPLPLSLLSVCCIIFACTYPQLIVASTNNIQPIPWWAKPISRDISTAGCLTQAQIEDVQRAGYKSLISMFNSETEEVMDDVAYPSTGSERELAEALGMKYGVILKPGEYDWMHLDTLRTFTKLFNEMPKPVLFHCMSSYSASFISMLYYVNQTKHRGDATEDLAITLDAEGMLTQAVAMGYDYSMEDAPLQMLRDVADKADLHMDITPELTQPYWNFGFWPLKPIANNWFTLGLLKLKQLQVLKDNDIDTIVSLRPGHQQTPKKDVTQGKRNVAPSSSTNKPDILNMECVELDADGEEVSVEAEKEAAQKAGLKYVFAPLDSPEVTPEIWARIRPVLLNAAINSKGILVHGKWPQTTVIVGLLATGCQQGGDSAWALDRLKRHGFHIQTHGGSTDADTSHVGNVKRSLGRLASVSWEYISPLIHTLGLDYLLTLDSNVHEDFDVINLFKTVLDKQDVTCET